MIKRELVLNRIYDDPRFVFRYGPYALPTKVISRKTGSPYDIRKAVKDHIDNEDKTGAVKAFLELFEPWAKDQSEFEYLREMVFLIKDEDLGHWQELYKGDNMERLYRNLFITDLFFPRLHLIVELDGKIYHEECKDPDKRIYDKARDEFLFSVYGLKTVRLNEETPYKRFETIKRVLRKQPRYDQPAFLDYSGEILDIYLGHTYDPACFYLITKYLLPLPGFYNTKNEEVGFPKTMKEPDKKDLERNKEDIREILKTLYEKVLHD